MQNQEYNIHKLSNLNKPPYNMSLHAKKHNATITTNTTTRKHATNKSFRLGLSKSNLYTWWSINLEFIISTDFITPGTCLNWGLFARFFAQLAFICGCVHFKMPHSNTFPYSSNVLIACILSNSFFFLIRSKLKLLFKFCDQFPIRQ